MVYRCIRAVLYRLPAEAAHELGFSALRALLRPSLLRRMVRSWLLLTGEDVAVTVLGKTFANPVGLAAGFDKNGVGIEALHALGFGFVEVGTVTGAPQPGNTKPRLFRLPRDRALVNRLGFNNIGSLRVADQIAARRTCVLGVNIGKTKAVSEERAVDDYRLSARRLGPSSDYLVVNVSSPNTPGLRALQAVDKLRPILIGVQEELRALQRSVPLLVKIAPDLADEEVVAVADLALETGLAGIIATNTTVTRHGLVSSAEQVAALGAGGLSGSPVAARAREVLRLLRTRVGDRLILISVGGIADADEAWTRICLGASLLQLYTGLVYEGPLLPRRIVQGLRQRAKAAGFSSIQGAVGSAIADSHGDR